MHRPIVSLSLQWDSALAVSSRSVSLLHLLVALLLGLLLQIRLAQGQSQQESAVCTITPRPVLVGVTSTPEEDWLGHSTSLSQNGTIAAIGARSYGSQNDGYVQVFRFENNNEWTQLGRTIFGDTSTNTFSNVLSDDGSIVAVGGLFTSSIRVFRLVIDDWEPLGINITHPSGKLIGYALSISGDGTIVAASNPYANSNVGEVLVFEFVEGTWIQKGSTLQGQGDELNFGWSVSLSKDGSQLAVGSPDASTYITSGFVRVFEFINNNWVQIGQVLEGASDVERFGNVVSLSSDGRTLAVGAPTYDGNFNNSGFVHVYRFGSDGQWLEPGAMLIGKSEGEDVGRFLALSGDASILVARGVGLLRFFEANGDEWIEVWEEATNSDDYNYAAISRDGSTAMGGASVFDISCQQETTADTATLSPVLSPPPTLTRAPVPAQGEAPVKTPIADPVLSPSPTGNSEPPDDYSIVSSRTTTPAGTETSPTTAPQTNPTSGTMVQETLSDVSLSFSGVSKMIGPEIAMFERLTKEWYETFFDERSGRMLQSLQLDAQNMQTTIEVTEQDVYLSEDDSLLVNKVTYKQTIEYTAESNNVDAKNYITYPFVEVAASTEYGGLLQTQLDAFQGLQSPLPIPQFEINNEGEGSAIGVIVGASIGGAFFLAVGVLVRIQVNKRKDDVEESVRAVQQPNAPMESQDQTSTQSQGRNLSSAAGLIVYDGQVEAQAPHTLASQAVLVSSGNPTTLQELLPKFKDQVRPR